MLIPFEEVIASPTFEFLLGREKKSLTVHESLVACHSEPLRAMMTGSMAEAKDRRAVLSNVEPHTFIRFAQYIYTGDYSVPVPQVLTGTSERETSDKVTPATTLEPEALFGKSAVLRVETPEPLDTFVAYEESAAFDDGWGVGLAKKKNSKKGTRATFGFDFPKDQPTSSSLTRLELVRHFVNACKEPNEQIPSSTAQVQIIHRNKDPCEEMTEIFLSHARVYVFADIYAIKELALLAIYKLRRCLSALRLFPQRITDLVVLIRFCYANTMEDDALRTLVADYSACMAEYLMEDQDFTALTKEDGVFSTDLLTRVTTRLA